MKKLLLTLMALLMSVSLVACSSGGGTTNEPAGTEGTDGAYTGPTEWVEATSREVQTMDYVVTALATDHELNANFVDGLLESDSHGQFVGALAESYESNEDATVWTFKLKQGIQWVTNTGEVYDELKAEDFVTGLRHAVEFDSGTGTLMEGLIKGYTEYKDSDYSDEAWEQVGVKAIDDYTVEYTLEKSAPYFYSLTTYSILFPVNREFLESKGTGCALGAPDKENCGFGTASADSILYNGAYIMEVFDAKSQTVLTKNESYWDAEHVYLEKVKRIYDDGSDPYSVISGFEQGSYVQAGLNPGWSDYATYAEKYADNAYAQLSNGYVFGVVFNYNRQAYEQTEYADDLTLRENTKNAIRNENFRKALRAAYDKEAYLAVSAPKDVAKSTLRNVNTFPELVANSEGKFYGQIVNEVYNETTGSNVDLSDGVDTFFNKDDALKYIEAAKADGIQFPVHLDMLVIETSDKLLKQAQSMKQSVEANTNGDIIIELVLRDEDTVQQIAYYSNSPAEADYDISTFTGWGPDYADPKSFVDIYSPTIGYYMKSVGLEMDNEFEGGNSPDKAVKEELGFYEYEELFRAADAITDDLDARYNAFALADAYLIDHALYIPTSQQTRSQVVSRIVPFTRCYGAVGISQYKYKGIKLQDELVTVDQYNTAYEAWKSGK